MSEGSVAADQLRLFIERIERLEEEKKGINDDIKDVYLEAKATGYDTKMMRQIIRLRKMDPNDRREMQAILETYLSALGMDGREAPQPQMFQDHDGRPDPATPAPAPTASEAERFETALSLVIEHQNASASWLQRQMRIGYNSASRLVEDLEKRGVVGPPNHVGKRDVLIAPGGDGVLGALADLHAICAKDGTSISMSIDGGPAIPIVSQAAAH